MVLQEGATLQERLPIMFVLEMHLLQVKWLNMHLVWLKLASLKVKRLKADWIMASNKMVVFIRWAKTTDDDCTCGIAKQAPILILDDSASALDSATDAKLRGGD